MTPTVVQAIGGHASASLTEVQTFTGAVTAGNSILACVFLSSPTAGQTWTSVTDNVNGAYTPIAASYETTASMQWFYLSSSLAAGANTLHVTCTSADATAPSFTDLIIHEVSGLTKPIVVNGANSASGTSAAPAVSVTGCQLNDLLLGTCQGSSVVVGAGFSLGAIDGIGRSEWGLAAPGTNSVAFTSNNAGWHATAIALASGGVNQAETVSVSDSATVLAPMILSTDIEFHGSGAANLGGAIAAALTSGDNTLWDDVTSGESTAGDIEYRCVYIKNNHSTTTWLSAIVWIDGPSAIGTVAIGVDNAPAGSTAESTSVDENTAPLPTVMFSSPATKGAGLPLGDIPAQSYKAVWIQRTIPSGNPSSGADWMSIRVEGESP